MTGAPAVIAGADFSDPVIVGENMALGPQSPLEVLWRGKWIVAACVLLGLFLAVLLLRSLPYLYTAELELAPTQQDAGLPRSLGSLASLAGVNLPKAQTSSFEIYIRMIQSQTVADELARDPVLMHTLFEKEWDGTNHRWKEPDGSVYRLAKAVKSDLGIPGAKWRAPDADRLLEFLKKGVVVGEDRRDSVATISFEHPDPRFAARLLRQISRSADEVLRRRALARTSASIQYIEGELDRVRLAEHREALAVALGEQERTRIFANSGVAFAADPLGEVSVSARPTSPKPLLVLGIGAIVGGLVGTGLAYAWTARRARG